MVAEDLVSAPVPKSTLHGIPCSSVSRLIICCLRAPNWHEVAALPPEVVGFCMRFCMFLNCAVSEKLNNL